MCIPAFNISLRITISAESTLYSTHPRDFFFSNSEKLRTCCLEVYYQAKFQDLAFNVTMLVPLIVSHVLHIGIIVGET